MHSVVAQRINYKAEDNGKGLYMSSKGYVCLKEEQRVAIQISPEIVHSSHERGDFRAVGAETETEQPCTRPQTRLVAEYSTRILANNPFRLSANQMQRSDTFWHSVL